MKIVFRKIFGIDKLWYLAGNENNAMGLVGRAKRFDNNNSHFVNIKARYEYDYK